MVIPFPKMLSPFIPCGCVMFSQCCLRCFNCRQLTYSHTSPSIVAVSLQSLRADRSFQVLADLLKVCLHQSHRGKLNLFFFSSLISKHTHFISRHCHHQSTALCKKEQCTTFCHMIWQGNRCKHYIDERGAATCCVNALQEEKTQKQKAKWVIMKEWWWTGMLFSPSGEVLFLSVLLANAVFCCLAALSAVLGCFINCCGPTRGVEILSSGIWNLKF